MKKKNKKKGLTLIEVILIIAAAIILAGVGWSVMKKGFRSAQEESTAYRCVTSVEDPNGYEEAIEKFRNAGFHLDDFNETNINSYMFLMETEISFREQEIAEQQRKLEADKSRLPFVRNVLEAVLETRTVTDCNSPQCSHKWGPHEKFCPECGQRRNLGRMRSSRRE